MKHLSFQDRWVIVTGASSGLGHAIAWRLATVEHARVIVVARREDRLQELCGQVAAAGGTARALAYDLCEPGAARAVLEGATQIAAGVPFALVNNAGVTWYGRFTEMPDGEADRIIDLNIRATIGLTRAFVAGHGTDARGATDDRARVGAGEPRAAILTVTSLGAHVPVPYQAVYAASKHALQAFSESIAMELREERFVVSTVEPGGIETEMISNAGLHGRFSPRALASGESVAAAALRSWKRGRLGSVPGVGNRLAALAARILPRRVVAAASERLFRP